MSNNQNRSGNRPNGSKPNHTHNNSHGNSHNNGNREPAIRTFILGSKELEGKVSEFEYDKGQYVIYDIVGEEKTEVFKSRNMQEAYTKWNVYIGRKKERPSRKRDEETETTASNQPSTEASKGESQKGSRNRGGEPKGNGNSNNGNSSNNSNSGNSNGNNRNRRNRNRGGHGGNSNNKSSNND